MINQYAALSYDVWQGYRNTTFQQYRVSFHQYSTHGTAEVIA